MPGGARGMLCCATLAAPSSSGTSNRRGTARVLAPLFIPTAIGMRPLSRVTTGLTLTPPPQRGGPAPRLADIVTAEAMPTNGFATATSRQDAALIAVARGIARALLTHRPPETSSRPRGALKGAEHDTRRFSERWPLDGLVARRDSCSPASDVPPRAGGGR
jgi:hypothetical protein